MSQTPSDYLDICEAVAREAIAPHAEEVDREGAFPKASIDALTHAGLLGLISSPEAGGLGQGPGAAAQVVRRVARECGSTGMVLAMHYAGTAVLEKCASLDVRRDAASGRHLSTLAFSEAGSRSHFWVPVSTAAQSGGKILLNARKSWVTTAGHATAYVWSSRPVAAEGLSTLWLVPRTAAGISMPGRYGGLGLRGNDSQPVAAERVAVTEADRLGPDGGGFDIMMGIVLPHFGLMNAGFSVGLMEAATARTAAHAGQIRHDHLNTSLAEYPTIRAYIARMQVKTDMAACLLDDAVEAVEKGRADAMLRALEAKAAAAESALEVLSLGMRVCAGAAYRREVGVERYFRDGQAASIMAPTTDQLYDFIGKAVCGLPLFS